MEKDSIQKDLAEIDESLARIGAYRDGLGDGRVLVRAEGWMEGERKHFRRDPLIGMEAALFYLPCALIICAEIAMLYDVMLGIGLHALVIAALIYGVSAVHSREDSAPNVLRHRLHDASNLLKALMLLPLIRIFGFTLPLVLFRQVYWPMIVSVPLLVSVWMLARSLKITLKDVGLTGGSWGPQMAIALSGIVIGFAEYLVLKPAPLINYLTPETVIVPALIQLAFTGFSEELIFRGLVQNFATRLFGAFDGIAYAAVLFTVMHVGFNSMPELSFVLAAALFYGIMYYKTGKLSGVIFSHGIANVVLFLVAPFVL